MGGDIVRNPDNIIQIDYDEAKEQVFKIENVPDYDIEDYDLNNEKELKRYFDSVERIVRNSFEYKQLVNFLKNYMDMNQCSFYQNVSGEDGYNIKIHIHHEPITLYDIVVAVFNKRTAMREPLTEDMVAKEVIFNHYKLRVGLIPLAETVHELVHNQYVFVPTTAVFGKYWEFVQIYDQYMDPECVDTLKKIEEISKRYTMDEAGNILSTNLIYVNTDEVFGKTDLKEVKEMLKEKLKKE